MGECVHRKGVFGELIVGCFERSNVGVESDAKNVVVV